MKLSKTIMFGWRHLLVIFALLMFSPSPASAVTGIPVGLIGSAGTTDNAVLRADGTGGTIAQNSLVTINDAGQIVAVAGSNTTPSYAFANNTDAGMYLAGVANTQLRFVLDSTHYMGLHTNCLEISSLMWLGWTTGTPANNDADLRLYRDAANVLALRNGTNAQTLRIYETESSNLANYERLAITTGGDALSLEAQTAGTGSDNLTIKLQPAGTGSVRIVTGNLWVDQLLMFGAQSVQTIDSGIIFVTESNTSVETEGAAGTDDLETIDGGNAGEFLILRAANSARTVVVKDAAAGGNIQCAGDCTLNNAQDTITLIYDGTNWLEMARADNGN